MSHTDDKPAAPAPTRILLINFHSAQNAGDLALLKMNLLQLRRAFATAQFCVTANHPHEPALQALDGVRVVSSPFALVGAGQGKAVALQILGLLFGVARALLAVVSPPRGKQAGGWAELFQAYREADLVASVSGNYLLSMGKIGWPFPLTAFTVWLAHLFHKPLYALPQSIGPFRRGWERWILRQLYRRARRVYLRDSISVALAGELRLGAHCHFAPDPAFALPMAPRAEALHILESFGYRPGQPAIGLTVLAPLTRAFSAPAIDQYYRDLAAVLLHLSEQTGARVWIFNQVTGPAAREDDRAAARRFLASLPARQDRLVLVDAPLAPEQLKACYACMDLMIASRLHSGIFAMGAGVPTVSIGYFTKARGLMQAMGLEDWLIELGKTSPAEMEHMISAAWQQRAALAEQTRHAAERFAQDTLRLGDELRDDFAAARPPLRVAQLVKGLDVGGVNGGSDVFGANLAAALAEAGVDARLLVFFQMQTPAEAQLLELFARQGLEVEFLQPWQGRTGLRAYWRGFRRLAAYLCAEQIDILHSHFQIGTLMAAWLRRIGAVRRALRTAHVDHEWQRGWAGPFQQALIRLFVFVLFPLALDRECGVSQAVVDGLNRRWLARLLRKPAAKIFNSIPTPDPEVLRQSLARAGEPKQPGAFVISTVGRMTDQKGYQYLLEAIPTVLADVPGARFVWVGDGPLRPALEQSAARLGLDQVICFTGVRDDVPALLDTTDLFVLPSVYEGLPTVVVESMARGVPVLGTVIPGTREMIHHAQNGWLVPPRDPSALAEAIVSLARNPAERTRLAQNAAESLGIFTIERAAQQYAAVYRELLP